MILEKDDSNSSSSNNNTKPILWEELSWKGIEKLTQHMNMVIVPVGACEQHGPHLPLAVDTIDCYEIARRVSAKIQVPVIPPLIYGCSQSHGNFPGTLSIRPETMIIVIIMISVMSLLLKKKYLATINVFNTATTERSEKARNIDIHYTLVLSRHTDVQYVEFCLGDKLENTQYILLPSSLINIRRLPNRSLGLHKVPQPIQ